MNNPKCHNCNDPAKLVYSLYWHAYYLDENEENKEFEEGCQDRSMVTRYYCESCMEPDINEKDLTRMEKYVDPEDMEKIKLLEKYLAS